MKIKIANLSLLLLCSLAASAQIKNLTIGRLTYIGEDLSGNSAFTVKLANWNLAAPIAFKAFNGAEVGAVGSNGPKPTLVSYSTPTELLFFAPAPPNGFNCPCLATLVQLVMDTTNPTVTITLKNGESITTYSTVNVYLTALPGQSAIQLQQWAPVVLHSVP
jgi:hypothetical protein